MTGTVRSVDLGGGREIRLIPFRDTDDRGVRLAIINQPAERVDPEPRFTGSSASASLSPEQAVAVADALVAAAFARLPKPAAPAMTAAELPDCSIVASRYDSWMKTESGWVTHAWARPLSDDQMDVEMARGGTTVLRVGDGTTGGGS